MRVVVLGPTTLKMEDMMEIVDRLRKERQEQKAKKFLESKGKESLSKPSTVTRPANLTQTGSEQSADSADVTCVAASDQIQGGSFLTEWDAEGDSECDQDDIVLTSKMLSISDMELQKRLFHLKAELTEIKNGKLYCERHVLFMKGTKSRMSLDHNASLHLLNDHQVDLAMETLLSMFSCGKLQNLDYMMRVILPEAITRIYKQTKSTTTSEQPLMEQAIVSLPACNLQTTGESCDDDQGKCSSHFNSDEDPEFGKGSDLEGLNNSSSDESTMKKTLTKATCTTTATTRPGHSRQRQRKDGSVSNSSDKSMERSSKKPRSHSPTNTKATAKTRPSRPRQRQRKEGSIRMRRKFACPVEGCDGEVIYLHRHLIQIHTEIPQHELPALLKKRKSGRHIKTWSCPENGCSWRGDRVDKHLMSKVHGFERHLAKAKAAEARQGQHPASTTKMRKHSFAQGFVSAESLAESFHVWFSSIEGGNFVPGFLEEHKQRERQTQNKKVKQMVKTVLQVAFGSDDFYVSRLGELTAIGRGSSSVINRLAEGRQWSTVRNYLHSYSHFLDFLDASVPPILDKATVGAMRASLKGCIRTVAKMSMEELQKRKVRDRHRLLNWGSVCDYIEREMAAAFMSGFRDMKDVEEKQAQAAKIGSHLLLQVAIQNGKRTGTFVDMTVDEFMGAEEEDGGFVVLVAEGKTFKVSGAAGVFLSNSEYGLLKEYVECCRPLFKPKTTQLFCRMNGQRSKASDIHKSLKEAWAEFGRHDIKDVGHISCNLIRKTLISNSRKLGVHREEQKQMAIHMDHSISTADRHYDTSTGSRLTAKFRTIIQRFRVPEESDSDDSDSDSSDHVDSDDHESLIPASEALFGSGSGLGVEENTQSINKLHKFPSQVHQTSSVSNVSSFRFGRACVFSEQDSVRICRCCAAVIDKGKKKQCIVTKAMILEALRSGGPNFVDILLNYTEEQICSKVRTEIRKGSCDQ